MVVAGIDLGSSATKCVLVDDTGALRGRALVTTRASFESVASRVLAAARAAAGTGAGEVGCVATTGLGRYAFPGRDVQIADVAAAARGAAALFPATRYVLDIGAQRSRAAALDAAGTVRQLEVDEECAAGSGGLLERVARSLEVDVADVGALSARAARPWAFSTGCAVLAEAEVVTLLAAGTSVEDILRGIHDALADRAVRLLERVGLDGEVTLIGGVALQQGMVMALRDRLGVRVNVPAAPQFTAALGAALVALPRARRLAAVA